MNQERSSVTNDPISEEKGPLLRVFLLGSLRLDWQVPPVEEGEAAWASRTSAREDWCYKAFFESINTTWQL